MKKWGKYSKYPNQIFSIDNSNFTPRLGGAVDRQTDRPYQAVHAILIKLAGKLFSSSSILSSMKTIQLWMWEYLRVQPITYLCSYFSEDKIQISPWRISGIFFFSWSKLEELFFFYSFQFQWWVILFLLLAVAFIINLLRQQGATNWYEKVKSSQI